MRAVAGRPTRPWMLLLAALLACAAPACAAQGQTQREEPWLWLDDGHVRLAIAPDLGGRVVHLSLPDRPNLLKVGAALAQVPPPEPAADGIDIPYLGHVLWTGPQSGWWLDQDVHAQRRDAAAPWPPDPWLAYGRNRVVERSAYAVALEGVDSPVSGLRARQRYRLSGRAPATVELEAGAVNVRDREIERDLWFNTRLPAASRVFVPVARPDDARLRADGDDFFAGPVAWWEDGLFSLQADPPPQGKGGRRGKVFIRPSAGWIAGFNAGQLLLIRFDLQPDASIHPEHGQVEVYQQWHHDDPDAGLLELEVHAPLRMLAPGESMRAAETWTVLPYDGPEMLEAQRAALLEALGEVGLAP